jgi:rubredoxin
LKGITLSLIVCPLCGIDKDAISVQASGENNNGVIVEYHQDARRKYWQCSLCWLVFVDPTQRLNAQQEKSEYDKHQNCAADMGYRKFLARLCDPLIKMLPASAKGLDFGCGPGPTLSVMLREKSFEVCNYDIFYADDRSLLQARYDFITATEVVEHLFEPGKVINDLWGMIEKGGVLGLMTKLVIDKESFSVWHYKNDLTHVCFFSIETFQYLAQQLNAELSIIGKDVIVLKKRE